MRCRIIPSGEFFVGQVYGKWSHQVLGIEQYQWQGWYTVTERCFTRIGAKIAVKYWIYKNGAVEMEL